MDLYVIVEIQRACLALHPMPTTALAPYTPVDRAGHTMPDTSDKPFCRYSVKETFSVNTDASATHKALHRKQELAI